MRQPYVHHVTAQDDARYASHRGPWLALCGESVTDWLRIWRTAANAVTFTNSFGEACRMCQFLSVMRGDDVKLGRPR